MRPINRIFLSATACCLLLSSAAVAADVEVRVLSGRADMVTGGDALVETNAALEKFNARLNGQDITRSFRPGKTVGTLIARVEGLKIGKNTLKVKSAKGRAKLEVLNYFQPFQGPSGFHWRRREIPSFCIL
jgi:hypothetical protein